MKAVLALASGRVFKGKSVGHYGKAVGEVVFNTAMSGYQEILTDPSYYQQIVALTCPHIGNIGTNPEDCESDKSYAKGLIVRDYSKHCSNWRSDVSLHDWMDARKLVGITEVDTRALTLYLRTHGAQAGCILSGENVDVDEAIAMAQSFSGIKGVDLAKEVSCSKSYSWNQGCWNIEGKIKESTGNIHVVVYDFGVKTNILRMLVDRGCRVSVVPAKTTAEQVLNMNPDGVMLSNGPGDPDPCDYAISAIQSLIEADVPIFGICLGHQLLALSCGATTEKMKFGHHGANHPVKDILTGKTMITSQNHGFSVRSDNLPTHLEITHQSLFDNSIQGIRHRHKSAFGFQGHPEASPGPHDIGGLFDDFVALIQDK